ncbi:MAG TPA: hypothetical protein DCG12_08710 [Planctomycetaceae bacterium]|nr:hypothetical protein [Planctomycetaceae bacterium]
MKTNRTASYIRTIVLAAGALGIFYGIGTRAGSDFFDRYFCGHPLEYVSTGMFFWGMAILFQKAVSLRGNRRALSSLQAVEDPTAGTLGAWCQDERKSSRQSVVFRRVEDTVNYLRGKDRSGLEEHLRYLAELANERLHQSFATIRTVTWAIPILGFLGTVIGITMAIANVTPEQLETSLGEVTSGLSVAFDTTALALGMSIVLVFAAFAVERLEQGVLTDLEQHVIERFLPTFAAGGSAAVSANPQIQAESEAWATQLSDMRNAWQEVLGEHTKTLRDAVDADLQQTLSLHRQDADSTRDTYGAALQQSTELLIGHAQELMDTFSHRLMTWQEAMQTSSLESVRQSEALQELGAVLLRVTESGDQIATLQQQLNQNLQALQVAETMEQTASSLTAAVHVLTARTSNRAA